MQVLSHVRLWLQKGNVTALENPSKMSSIDDGVDMGSMKIGESGGVD